MSDRMEKEAMQKFFNYMKSYYPPNSYMRNPYYQPSQDDKEEKEKKNQTAVDPYSHMYGYPPYNPYQMHSMYSQPYPNQESDKRDQDRNKHQMPSLYSQYYPYSHYPYYHPYAYPPYYYGQREYPSKATSLPPAPPSPLPSTPQQQPQIAQQLPPTPPEPLQLKILSKPQEKPVKEEIVISSDSEQPAQAPPAKPVLNQAEPMVQEKPVEKKQVECVNVEENELDPFFISKKPKIFKVEKEQRTRISRTPLPDKQKHILTRYTGMPAEAYQEMIKKQTRKHLELFYQRERERKEQERCKDKEKEKEKEKESLKNGKTGEKVQKLEDKKSSDNKSDKEYKDKVLAALSIPFMEAAKISAMHEERDQKEERDAKRERIKDDHPLKELRYNQSHGRIRLGNYFQSTIPQLMRHQELSARKLELQKRLREREVSAITF